MFNVARNDVPRLDGLFGKKCATVALGLKLVGLVGPKHHEKKLAKDDQRL